MMDYAVLPDSLDRFADLWYTKYNQHPSICTMKDCVYQIERNKRDQDVLQICGLGKLGLTCSDTGKEV